MLGGGAHLFLGKRKTVRYIYIHIIFTVCSYAFGILVICRTATKIVYDPDTTNDDP